MWRIWAGMMALGLISRQILDQPDGGPSAFFIDNKTRRTVPTTAADALRYWLKVLLLFYSLFVEHRLLFSSLAATGQRKKTDAGRPASFVREWLCLLCGAMFVVRVLVQMMWWRRTISWVEVFAETGVIIPLSLASLGFGASRRQGKPIGVVELLGLLLFLLGTCINMWPEYTRHIWKSDPANTGRLYTGGMFSMCRHINYFGEVLSFVGFALVSAALWNLWIPFVMGVGLMVFSVPELDAYLSTRYTTDWAAYVDSVHCQMIPLVW